MSMPSDLVRCSNSSCWEEATERVAEIPLCGSHAGTILPVLAVPDEPLVKGLVYYAFFEEAQQVKIGSTANPARRFLTFRNDYCRELGPFRILVAEPGGLARERQRHLEHHGSRVPGKTEFFRYEPELEAAIQRLRERIPEWRRLSGIHPKYF